MNVKKEIELAIKKENPNWDGKSFDYGIAIYQNVLECWEAIEPLIEKAGHSGASYSFFSSIFKRVLDGKVLTPIVDEDFFVEEQEIYDNPNSLKENGLKSVLQCPRYTSLFRRESLDGKVTYHDVDRIVIINQDNISYYCKAIEDLCSEYIPPIEMPYMPTEPIKIYVHDNEMNDGSEEIGFINYIVLPNNKIIEVNKSYSI